MKNIWLKTSFCKFLNCGHCGWVFDVPFNEWQDPIWGQRQLTTRFVIRFDGTLRRIWTPDKNHGAMVLAMAEDAKEALMLRYKSKKDDYENRKARYKAGLSGEWVI